MIIKLIIKLIILGIAGFLSSRLYRLAGQKKEGNAWDILRNKLTRRIGCSLITLAMVYFVYGVRCHPGWYIALFFGQWGALSSYWDKVFGYDNHFAHGFGVGLAMLPIAIVTGLWWGFISQTIVCTVWMGLVSVLSANDDFEEYGRGLAVIGRLPFMFGF